MINCMTKYLRMLTTTTTETVISAVGLPKHATTTTTTTTMKSDSVHLRILSPVGAEPYEFEYSPGVDSVSVNILSIPQTVLSNGFYFRFRKS